MLKKTRYLLLALCCLVFLILAPIIVLYVRGVTYNFATHSFVKTGILGVRVDPGNAEIFLNGKLKRKSQGDIKFLLPGEYQIAIQKPGYQEWDKRLLVYPGEVTWANPSFGSVYLFFSNPAINTLSGAVLDFYHNNQKLVMLTANGIILAPVSNPSSEASYGLPKNVNTILAADAGGKNFALINNNATSSPTLLLFNTDNNQVTDISNLFPTSTPKLKFGDNGQIYALSGQILYQVDAANKTKTALFGAVKAFFAQGSNIYYIAADQKGNNQLFLSQSPFSQSQSLAALPAFSAGDLWVTFGKEIFLEADGSLYQVSSNMQPLATNVTYWTVASGDSSFSLVHSGELDYYDTSAHILKFVTRSNETVSNAVINTGTNEAFFIKNNQMVAIELDTRDNQNQYVLYKGQNLEKFFIDDAGKNVWLLDNGNLKLLPMR